MPTRFLALLCLPTLISVSTPAVAFGWDAAAGHRVALFNGENLDGWTIENNCKASAKDGAILLEEGNGWLRSHYPLGDFKLTVEWKALKDSGYDAGIYIRTPAAGKPFPKGGCQINLLEGKEGNIGNLKGATPSAAAQKALKPADWNTFEITVRGNEVELQINGTPAYKTGGIQRAIGFVGLQCEVPKGGRFLVRRFDVVEPEHRSLFNGKDLAGWEGAGKPASDCWAVENGELVCLKKPGPWLRSNETYGDFNLRLEYQVNRNGNSGVFVRVPKNGNHHRDKESQPPAGFEVQILDDGYGEKRKLKPYQYCGSVYDIAGATKHVGRKPGEWNTLEINCRGRNVHTLHNGVMIVEATPEKYPQIELRQLKGYLGLQNHGGGVRFRNLRVGPPVEDYGMKPAK